MPWAKCCWPFRPEISDYSDYSDHSDYSDYSDFSENLGLGQKKFPENGVVSWKIHWNKESGAPKPRFSLTPQERTLLHPVVRIIPRVVRSGRSRLPILVALIALIARSTLIPLAFAFILCA